MLVQRISVAPSVRLALALCTAHVAAAGVLWVAPLPLEVSAVLTAMIAVSLVYTLARDAALHAGDAIVALEIDDGGGISFQTRRGDWLECELLGSSYVASRLTIVNLRPRGRRRARHVILVPGNVDPREFRRLRMWLRWATQRSADTP
jgi:toxin CptA